MTKQFLAAILAACLPIAAFTQEIKLGGIFDLSSSSGKVWGDSEKKGFFLAIKDFEKAHPSFKVKALIEDSEYSNQKSVSAFHKLTSIDKVEQIIGPTWETFSALMPLCERSRKLCFAPSYNGSLFRAPKEKLVYSFSVFFEDAGYGEVLAEEVNRLGLKRVALVSANHTEYFEDLTNGFLNKVIVKPLEVVRIGGDLQDMRSVIARLPKDLEALVTFVDAGTQAYPLLRQWVELKGKKVLVFADDGTALFSPEIDKIKALGLDIRYSYPSFEPGVEERWNKKFFDEYSEQPGSPGAVIAYDETMIVLECARKTPGQAEKIHSCVSQLDGYQGLSGTLSFRAGNSFTGRKYMLKQL